MNADQVAVLYNVSEKLVKGDTRDMIAEQGVIICAQVVIEALETAGWRVARVPFQAEVELALAPYPPDQWIVFNLGEGLEGRLFEEARIGWALEAMGYCFTGNGGEALSCTLNKARAKAVLSAAGVPTAPWWLFRHPDEVKARAASLPFPLIVKPMAEDASQGIGLDAVVYTAEALRERVAHVNECYRQVALAESFIDGREFNVSLWDKLPTVLPLAEIDFSAFANPHERIVSFPAKWETDTFEYRNTNVFCPAQVDAELGERIADVARRAWAITGCRGYARVDIRLSAEGIPYVLEVNCNPDISPDAGFFRASRAAGYTYQEMVLHMIEIAREQFNV